jgi:hypothetical protein
MLSKQGFLTLAGMKIAQRALKNMNQCLDLPQAKEVSSSVRAWRSEQSGASRWFYDVTRAGGKHTCWLRLCIAQKLTLLDKRNADLVFKRVPLMLQNTFFFFFGW